MRQHKTRPVANLMGEIRGSRARASGREVLSLIKQINALEPGQTLAVGNKIFARARKGKIVVSRLE